MTRLGTPLFSMTITALAMCGAAAFADTGIKVGDSAMGPVLTDANGMTLYTFDKDTKGAAASACMDKCIAAWPPFLAPDGAMAEGEWTIVDVKDADGAMKKMWAYEGSPLYLFVKDTKPGDVNGEGVNDVWHVAKPMS